MGEADVGPQDRGLMADSKSGFKAPKPPPLPNKAKAPPPPLPKAGAPKAGAPKAGAPKAGAWRLRETPLDVPEKKSSAPKRAPSKRPSIPPLLVQPPPRAILPLSTHDVGNDEAPAVLVVDDDPTIRRLIVRALRTSYTVYDAEDGEDAARILDRVPPVACIILDIMMPRMDGITLTKRIRADPRLADVPVVFVTGDGAPATVLGGINLGVRYYIQKPFKVKDLVEKIRSVVDPPKKAERAQ